MNVDNLGFISDKVESDNSDHGRPNILVVDNIYRITATLPGGEPVCFRDFEIREDSTFAELHAVVQQYFNWISPANHSFYNYIDGDIIRIASHERLNQVFRRRGDKCNYFYFNFDSPRQHFYVILKMEEKRPAEPQVQYPRLVSIAGDHPNATLNGNSHYYANLMDLHYAQV